MSAVPGKGPDPSAIGLGKFGSERQPDAARTWAISIGEQQLHFWIGPLPSLLTSRDDAWFQRRVGRPDRLLGRGASRPIRALALRDNFTTAYDGFYVALVLL